MDLQDRIEELQRRVNLGKDIEGLKEDPRWVAVLEVIGEFREYVLMQLANPDAKHLEFDRGRFAALDQVKAWILRAVSSADGYRKLLERELERAKRHGESAPE